MFVCQLSCTARSGAMSTTDGGRPENDEAQNMVYLKNAICVGTMSIHDVPRPRCPWRLSSSWAKSYFTRDNLLDSLRRSLWFIHLVLYEKVDARAFLSVVVTKIVSWSCESLFGEPDCWCFAWTQSTSILGLEFIWVLYKQCARVFSYD